MREELSHIGGYDLDTIQAGVIGSSDLAISNISINSTTGAITFTVASGSAWVKDVQGALLRIQPQQQTVTLTPPTLPTFNGQGVIVGAGIDSNGTVSLTSGAIYTPAGGVTIATDDAAHTPAVVAGRLRIADFAILYTTVTGYEPFKNGPNTWTQGQDWLDRRPWARGLDIAVPQNGADQYNSTGGWSAHTNWDTRFEVTGTRVVEIVMFASGGYGGGQAAQQIRQNYMLVLDGAGWGPGSAVYSFAPNVPVYFVMSARAVLAAGSHFLRAQSQNMSGANFPTFLEGDMRIRELASNTLPQNNGTA